MRALPGARDRRGKTRSAREGPHDGSGCHREQGGERRRSGAPAYRLMHEPEETIRIVEWRVRGFGPTYASKLLRFAVPQVFGAIDIRLVRIFGRGDPGMQRYPLLDLAALPV